MQSIVNTLNANKEKEGYQCKAITTTLTIPTLLPTMPTKPITSTTVLELTLYLPGK